MKVYKRKDVVVDIKRILSAAVRAHRTRDKEKVTNESIFFTVEKKAC